MLSRKLIFTTSLTLLLFISTSFDQNIHLKTIHNTMELNNNNIITKNTVYPIDQKIIIFNKFAFLNKIVITDNNKYKINSNSFFDSFIDIGIHNQVCNLDNDILICKHVNDYVIERSSYSLFPFKYILISLVIVIFGYINFG